MNSFVGFLFGKIKVKGSFEKILSLINEMSKCNLQTFGLKKCDDDELLFFSSYRDRLRIKDLCSLMKIDVETEVLGLPRLFLLYKKRIGLFIGAFLACLTIFFSSMLIWSFEVVGNERLSDSEVISLLQSEGLKIGTFKKKHNLYLISLNAELKCEDIAWLAVNFKGTKAVIELRETEKKPDIYDNTTPTNIVAKYGGQIIYAEAVSGSLSIKRYDVVEKGDLLISGIVDSARYGYKLVRARGRVLAETEHNFTVCIPLEKESKSYTGRRYSKTRLFISGYEPLKNSHKCKYALYDVSEKIESITIFNSFKLPINKLTYTYTEYVPKTVKLSYEQALKEAENELQDIINQELSGAEILTREQSVIKENDKITVSLKIRCIEDICSEYLLDKA